MENESGCGENRIADDLVLYVREDGKENQKPDHHKEMKRVLEKIEN